MRFLILVIAALALLPFGALAQSPDSRPQVGDTFEVKLERTSEGTNGSSFTRNTLIERVVAVREDGLELVFDLPAESRPQWQFPVRVFRPHDGPMHLLNGDELDKRLDAWLVAARIPRTACGRWIFTWTAFKIECDPLSALRMAEQFDLHGRGFRDGQSYAESGTLGPSPLRLTVDASGAVTFAVMLAIDPATVRQGLAERDVALGDITGNAVTLEEAGRAHADDGIAGTLSITFEMDAAGDVRRSTRTTVLETTTAEGQETDTTTETIVRRRLDRR